MSAKLKLAEEQRDVLMLQLWGVFDTISKERCKLQLAPNMLDEDAAIWAALTGHSSIQRKITESRRKKHAETT